MDFYCCSIFKAEIRTEEDKRHVQQALAACNKLAAIDSSPPVDGPPDALLLARDVKGEVVGFLCLHFHERNFAWELGTCCACKPFRHSILMHKFMEYLTRELALYYRRFPQLPRKAFLVQRLKQSETKRIEFLQSLGFHRPQWLEAILSDDGYIPFEPPDEILVKKKVFPNIFTHIEKLEADINKSKRTPRNP